LLFQISAFLYKLLVGIHVKNTYFCRGKEKDTYREEPAASRVLFLVLVLKRSLWDIHLDCLRMAIPFFLPPKRKNYIHTAAHEITST